MQSAFYPPLPLGERVHFVGIDRSRGILTRPVYRRESPLVCMEEDGAGRLIRFLFHQSGLDASYYRPEALARRLPACLRALGASTVEDGWLRISQNPERIHAALDALLLGVTRFFRDHEVFVHLEERVLPELLRRQGRLRVWSAACSTGEELYSVGLLLEAAAELDRVELVGTDCRESALITAERGIYSNHSPERPGSGERRWTDSMPLAEMSPVLRSRVRWRRSDLLTGAEVGPWDLILWRNMAIYLSAEAASKVWDQLWRELRPGGVLVSGKAEQPPADRGFVRLALCIYQKPLLNPHAS